MMKVLLIGEFSGVQNNLKAGLEYYGVQVTLANAGDGYKKFSSDIPMHVNGDSRRAKIENRVLESYNLFNIRRYDVVQLMHPGALDFYDHSRVYEALDKAKFVVQLLGGCDYVFAKNYKYLCEDLCKMCKCYDLKWHKCRCESSEEIRYEREIYRRADVMVPLAWEYYKTYKDYAPEYEDKLQMVIPMPIDITKNKVRSLPHGKKQVFHPLNREGYKGTKVLRPIFEQLQKEYGEYADFRIEGRLPINEYRRLLAGVDVVVDELYADTYGMNALYAMAMGKAVMNGGHRRTEMFQDIKWLEHMPVLSLGCDEEEIKDSIIRTVKDDKLLRKIKQKSRKYVETYHDARKVAKLFLNLYRQYL